MRGTTTRAVWGESTRRRAPDETRARLERGRGDECEISRKREERIREPSHGVVAVGGGDSGGGVAVVLRWSVCLVDDDGSDGRSKVA